MISGLNQDVDVLGKTFHFQTELSDQNGLSIRTEVFVGGKVVATRESRVEDGSDPESEAAIRGRMKEQHAQVIKTFVARAQRYQSRGSEGEGGKEVPEAVPPTTAEPPSPEPPSPEPPSPEPLRRASSSSAVQLEPPEVPSPEVAFALQVRRFFAKFRRIVGIGEDVPKELKRRLAQTAQTLTWMIRSPLFAEIRIDEQARCHLLKEQIDEWLMGGCDRWRGAQIWSNVTTFSLYLAEVNLRSELVEHDQQLLIWALAEVQRHGMSEEMLNRLAALYGRHPRLDRLLDAPEGVAAGAWTAHLRSVLTLL